MQPPGREPAGRLDRPTLGEVAGLALECSLCRLCHGRRRVLFGSGNDRARLMFVTEAPGYHEDAAGHHFAGAAGELFELLLASIDLTRDDVYVTSVVKCRPPRNRTPFPDEVEQCEGYLFRQVTMVQPAVICALGNVPIQLLTGRPHSLSRVHGSPFSAAVQGRDVTIYPLYHPAATLGHAGLRAVLEEDFRALPRLLQGERLPEGVRVASQRAVVASTVPTAGGPQAMPAGADAAAAAREPSAAAASHAVPERDDAGDQLSLNLHG